ncbi:hypothetical protein J7L49_06945 [Candidatus Bathyarchaeota archaeon]|nr:hypothetical protein [Candidatus Bathyarchaeota archaeon]
MAKIDTVEFNVSSISENSAVKLSTHEVAIYPHTFGEIYKAYATTQRKWSLTGSETNSFNIDVYRKLERLMRIGKSVTVDLPEINRYSVGFITSVKLSKQQDVISEFQVDVEEGLHNYIHGCDDITDWVSNGTLTVDTNDYKEGTGSVKINGSMDAEVALYAKAPITIPPRFLMCDWIAFWFKTDNITDLSNITVKLLVDNNNYASINVTNQVSQVNTWILIRFKRENMTLTGTIDWNRVAAFQIEKTHSTTQTQTNWIDDICAYQ